MMDKYHVIAIMAAVVYDVRQAGPVERSVDLAYELYASVIEQSAGAKRARHEEAAFKRRKEALAKNLVSPA